MKLDEFRIEHTLLPALLGVCVLIGGLMIVLLSLPWETKEHAREARMQLEGAIQRVQENAARAAEQNAANIERTGVMLSQLTATVQSLSESVAVLHQQIIDDEAMGLWSPRRKPANRGKE